MEKMMMKKKNDQCLPISVAMGIVSTSVFGKYSLDGSVTDYVRLVCFGAST
jgi:hypothetical protein